MENGYFQVFQNDAGTCLRVIGAVDGGDEISISEVMEFLDRQGIPYDLPALKQGIQTANQGLEKERLLPLTSRFFPPVPEFYKMSVSSDRMKVLIRLYPPSSGGGRISAERLCRELEQQKIIHGVKKEETAVFFANPQYCTDFAVAEGTPPRHGTNGRIEYLFSTDVSSKPAWKEDGSVDFFHLNNITHCSKGQVLARLIPEDPGDFGYTVYGEKIRPRDVKKLSLKPTNHVSLSEDKLALIAEVDGHVTLVEDKVFASNVLTVEHVNSVTGNIDFEGSVLVLGNVCTNFTVKAKGNIEVRGVVEGALVESGKDVIIARGVKGMGRGVIRAEGNVIAQFLENAKVKAGGYVSADLALHSEIIAGTEIHVTSKKGFIAGGRVCAGNLISVRTLGSEMGSDTLVEVGVDPAMKLTIQRLQKRIAELARERKTVQPVLNAMAQKIAQGVRMQPDQIKYIQNLTIENRQRTEEMEASMEEIERLRQIFEFSADAQVIVTGHVYVGTLISIGDASMTVKSGMSYCRFVKEQGEVRMTAI